MPVCWHIVSLDDHYQYQSMMLFNHTFYPIDLFSCPSMIVQPTYSPFASLKLPSYVYLSYVCYSSHSLLSSSLHLLFFLICLCQFLFFHQKFLLLISTMYIMVDVLPYAAVGGIASYIKALLSMSLS